MQPACQVIRVIPFLFVLTANPIDASMYPMTNETNPTTRSISDAQRAHNLELLAAMTPVRMHRSAKGLGAYHYRRGLSLAATLAQVAADHPEIHAACEDSVFRGYEQESEQDACERGITVAELAATRAI